MTSLDIDPALLPANRGRECNAVGIVQVRATEILMNPKAPKNLATQSSYSAL